MQNIALIGGADIGRAQGFQNLNVLFGEIELETEGGGTRQMPTMTTRWKPTTMELAALVGGALLEICMWGHAHPPITVQINPVIPGFREPRGWLVMDPNGASTFTVEHEIVANAHSLGWATTALYD